MFTPKVSTSLCNEAYIDLTIKTIKTKFELPQTLGPQTLIKKSMFQPNAVLS